MIFIVLDKFPRFVFCLCHVFTFSRCWEHVGTIWGSLWEHVGIIRSYKGLLLARKKLNKIYKEIRDIRDITINNKANNLIYIYYECLNLLCVSLSVINSSLNRKESVGLHFLCDVC